MSLLGLLLCGLGIGYAVHKDNQKFARMRADAIKQSGRGVVESIDDVSITNKYYREVKKYFDDRYNYYNNKDYLINHTNIESQMEQLPLKKIEWSFEELQQVFAGWLAYEDLCAKYAPDYKEEAKRIYSWMNPYNPGCFATIARALARKEVYKLGFKPSHMATMSSPLNGHGLYFYDGTFGSAMDYPTEYDYNKLDKENPFKYLTVFEVNKIGFRRT